MLLDICPKKHVTLLLRSFSTDVKSTADSFKSWDTCMDNKTCKIVAIVGIVLAALVALWIVSTLIRCCCMGFSCLEALCCCCCRGARRTHYVEPVQANPFDNPNMYPRAQPMMMAQPAYQPVAQPYHGRLYSEDEDAYGHTHEGHTQKNEGYKVLQF